MLDITIMIYRLNGPPDVIRAKGVGQDAPVVTLGLYDISAIHYQHYVVVSAKYDEPLLRSYVSHIMGDKTADAETVAVVDQLEAMPRRFFPPTARPGPPPVVPSPKSEPEQEVRVEEKDLEPLAKAMLMSMQTDKEEEEEQPAAPMQQAIEICHRCLWW